LGLGTWDLKFLLTTLSDFLNSAFNFLVTAGPFGLFAIALLDSALVPLPAGPDAVMMGLSALNPEWMPVYAVSATVGSVIGCIFLYQLSAKTGNKALSKIAPDKQNQIKSWIERYDMLSILVASVLPPPFPFKAFVITAGVFRFSLWRVVIAITIGRAFRFFLEGYLAIRYGQQAKEILEQNYPTIGITLAVLIILIFIGRSFFKNKDDESIPPAVAGG